MKRAVAAFALAAGLCGCTSTPKAPTSAYPADARGAAPEKGTTATKRDAGVVTGAYYGVDRVTMTGGDPNIRQVNGVRNLDPNTYGPTQSGIAAAFGGGGIMPAPGSPPWGVVAMVPGAAAGGGAGRYADGRTSINFISTPSTSKMRVGFQDASRGFVDVLAVPQHYNFLQGNLYRLRLSNIPNRPEAVYFPTLEVYPATRDTVTFLAHGTVPIGFTDEDFDQVKTGNMVVKVIYLPSAQFQDVAAEEIVSTRLEPGADPVIEATRKGTVLAVIRMGNINLENANSPAMDAPPGMVAPGGGMMMAPSPRLMPAPAPGPGPLLPAPLTMKEEPKKTGGDLASKPKSNLPADLPPITLPTPKK